MTYELNTCPYCGAGGPIKIGSETYDSNDFIVYRCSSCDEVFSGLKSYKRKIEYYTRPLDDEPVTQTPEDDINDIEEADPVNSVEVEVSHIEERTSSPKSASSVYKKTIKCTIAMACQSSDGISCGTGTVISKDGYFLSNAHVVSELSEDHKTVENFCDEIYGESGAEQYRFDAEVIYVDPEIDLALLKTEPNDSLCPVNFSNRVVEYGDRVYAIGNSKGEGLCIVEGIVSDPRRRLEGKNYLMVSAPVTNGNSGGPLFDDNGDLIGIVARGRKDVVSMNYAIPNDVIMRFLSEAEEKEGVEIF